MLDLGLFGRIEAAEQISRKLFAPAGMGARVNDGTPSSPPRTFSRPSRILPLTVPRGRSSMSEISVWLNPPKKASLITFDCFSGRSSSTALTSLCVSLRSAVSSVFSADSHPSRVASSS